MPEPALGYNIGFFGKLPTQGDFVSRSLPADFTSVWDDWLQRGISKSREQLGEAWLDLFMTMPPWHFSFGPGVCGEAAVSGVVIPSVDRVGRCFPFTLAVIMSELHVPDESASNWHEQLEVAALKVLDPGFTMDNYLDELQAVQLPENVLNPVVERAVVLTTSNEGFCRQVLAFAAPRVTLLWTHGGEAMDASYLAFSGLPDSTHFAGMLDGDWRCWGVTGEPG